MASILELIACPDPLNDEAVRFVLSYREETTLIDFKVTLINEDDKWLDLTKDVMAFANTDGGYLAFGVRDKTFEMEGLDATACALFDTNNWHQKLNRYVEPQFTSLRCRTIEIDGKHFAVVFVPASKSRTHVISKDAVVKGTTKVVLRQGTFYVRRSGAVHLGDARDFDEVVERRLYHARASLMDKIAQVVSAPSDAQVLMVKQQGQDGLGPNLVVENSPDGMPMKGMKVNIEPQTPEQEVTLWKAIKARPSAAKLWSWYRMRKELQFTADQKLEVATYCLLEGIPAFYWLKDCDGEDIKKMLVDLLDRTPPLKVVESLMGVSAFFGKRFHSSQYAKLGPYKKLLRANDFIFPAEGARKAFIGSLVMRRKGGVVTDEDFEAELDQIAAECAEIKDGAPGDRSKEWQAEKLDCRLYARDDRYKGGDDDA